MNYYIQGNAADADKIKAAFEKLGYKTIEYCFNAERTLYFTFGGAIKAATCEPYKSIINTHPDYKELELPVETKFKVGNWVVIDNCHNSTYQVDSVRNYDYMLKHTHGGLMPFPFSDEKRLSLWTLADAKDGDVLTDGKKIVIFNKFEEPAYKQHIIAYVGLDLCGKLQITEDTWRLGVDKAMPATKEQRDLLFQKMKEAGYEWDADKKELRKIQPHYDIKNFKPFDKVLVRDEDTDMWTASLYSNYDNFTKRHFVAIDSCYSQCIPYNNDTKHLLGTTDPCDECYINW